MLEVADLLCREHARCDAVEIARYYASLSDAGLVRGREDDLSFAAAHAEIRGARGLQGEAWLAVRARVLEDLARLALHGEAAEDRIPRARALALAALLRTEELERSSSAAVHDWSSELALARDEARGSLEIFAAAGMQRARLEPLWVVGRLERLAGERIAARAALEECLAEAERLGQPGFGERASTVLLVLAREAGDDHQQLRLLGRLARLCSPDESWPLVRDYARWILQRDQPRVAFELLARHPVDAERPGAESDACDWRLLAGSAALRAGDLATAREHFDWLSDANSRVEVLAQASLSLAAGRPEEVVAALGDGGLALGYAPLEEATGYSMLGEAELRLGRTEPARSHLEHALELSERWRAELGDGGRSVFGEWVGLHTVTLLAQAQAQVGRELDAARTIESFQSRALREAQGPASAATLTADELSAWADAYPLGLVTWAIGADFGVVAHVAPVREGESNASRAWAAPIARGRTELRTAARRLREALLAGRDEHAHALASEIAAAIVPRELAERLGALALGASSPPRLLALAHGPLESLPLEFLFEREGGIARDVSLVVLPGLVQGLPAQGVIDFSALTGWTLVAGNGETGELPAAAAEVRALEGALRGARRLEADDAARELDLALARGAPLHVATHLEYGCGCEDTRLAPLALALPDGSTLCAHEVARLAPASPLVFLGACESGGGDFVDAEGLQGLTRAFLESGTRNVVVTLWPVEDGAARDFALAFHAELRSSASPACATHRARRALAARGAAPSVWAAFRLVGVD